MFYKLGLLIVTRARLVLALGLVALAISGTSAAAPSQPAARLWRSGWTATPA